MVNDSIEKTAYKTSKMWVEILVLMLAECEQYDMKTSLLGSYQGKISPNSPALPYRYDAR